MATTFKTLTAEDISNTRTYLNESIPITSSIVSGTYIDTGVENNIYRYSHGMFETVFDYPYASSSANNLFDITLGHNSSAPTFNSSTTTQNSKKANIYSQMSKILSGVDTTGSILSFDEDGVVSANNDYKINTAFFLNFSRLLVKDEIKKGSFRMSYATVASASSPTKANLFATTGTISDVSGATTYFTNSPAGEYGILYQTDANANIQTTQTNRAVGLIYYQAGVVVLNSNIFAASGTSAITTDLDTNQRGQLGTKATMFYSTGAYTDITDLFTNATIEASADALRRRIGDISFQNVTELNSSIYFIKVNNSEFNYSSNPTYLSSSQIYVKNGVSNNAAFSYITTVGLYSADNALLAVAKLSEPIKKSQDQSLMLRVRLDY